MFRSRLRTGTRCWRTYQANSKASPGKVTVELAVYYRGRITYRAK